MFKKLVPITLSLAFTFAPALAAQHAPVKKHIPPPPDYFPLKKDYWWKYESQSANGQKSEFMVKVLEENKQPDETIRYLAETSFAVMKPIHDVYSKPKGWVLMHHQQYLQSGAEADWVPTKQFLQNPLNKESAWEWSGKGTAMNVDVSEKNSVVGPEDVEVTAGKFKAMKVTTEVTQSGTPMKKVYWYAPWVGLVKSTTDSGSVHSETQLLDYSFKPKPKPEK